MIRVLIFLLSVIFVAGSVTYFAGMQERIEARAFGYIYDIHAGAALATAFVGVLLVIFFVSWFKDLAALPGKLKNREREAKRARGVIALTRGLEAVAVGDAKDAQHYARIANRNLEDEALTRLLTAQAAQLVGDETTAGENFTAMLDAPETEFLGLRGLYLKARRDGDKEAARTYAERAFRLRTNAKWAFESLFELGLERGAWGETRNALKVAQKNKVLDAAKAKRGEAALLTADAYASVGAENKGLALEEAEAALKLAPGFAPAAVLAAERHAASDRIPRAAKILEQAFSDNPHPALLRAHDALFAKESTDERAAQMKKIADRKPTAREAKLHFALRHNLLGEHDAAIALLEPLLMDRATAREEAAMADAVAGAHGAEAARKWFELAAKARRDPTPGAEGVFNFTREGWARLVVEFMEHGRLAPPPLEDAPEGLSLDDLKLLAPPQPPAKPAPIAPAAPSAGAGAGAGIAAAGASPGSSASKKSDTTGQPEPADGAEKPPSSDKKSTSGDLAGAAPASPSSEAAHTAPAPAATSAPEDIKAAAIDVEVVDRSAADAAQDAADADFSEKASDRGDAGTKRTPPPTDASSS
ncbi:MAG: heme biosynthesis HemY N-terminal domain-containing protein [Pseudomonadota bacterium]